MTTEIADNQLTTFLSCDGDTVTRITTYADILEQRYVHVARPLPASGWLETLTVNLNAGSDKIDHDARGMVLAAAVVAAEGVAEGLVLIEADLPGRNHLGSQYLMTSADFAEVVGSARREPHI